MLARFTSAGYSRSYVAALLPDWWDSSLNESESAVAQAGLELARLLGVRPSQLIWGKKGLQLDLPGSVRYKNVDRSTASLGVTHATACAYSLARTIKQIWSLPYVPVSGDAAGLRRHLLDVEGRPWVSFESLVEYCWASGIPVVHLTEAPSGHGLDGIAVMIDDRPIILLLSRQINPAYHLFVLAHELGHIALGHLNGGGAIVDRIESPEAGVDSDERAANQFALRLISGELSQQSFTPAGTPSAELLAGAALSIGALRKVDPGHIVLRYARGGGTAPAVQGALKLLATKVPSLACAASELTNRIAMDRLSSQAPLSDDVWQHLTRMLKPM